MLNNLASFSAKYPESRAARYLIGLLAFGVTFLVRLILWPILGATAPYMFFFPAIVLSAWYGGFGSGLLTTGLGAIASLFLLRSQRVVSSTPIVVAWTLYVLTGTCISWLNRAFRRAEIRAQQQLLASNQYEQALRTSEERLTFALEAGGGVGTWDWDIPSDRVFCNPEFARLYSVDPSTAAAGAPITAFVAHIHAEDTERVSESIRRATDTGGDFSEEYRIVQQDGSARWVYARGRCHLDADGRPTRFPGAAFDITERKQSEGHLRQQWHTFDTALSNTPDFTYIFDLQGRFTYANRGLLSLLQIRLEDIIGKNFFELGYPHDLAAKLQAQIYAVIESKGPIRDQTSFAGPDGDSRDYEYIFVPVLGSDGRVDTVVGSTRDVTDQKRREQQLRKANRELEEFAYVTSHDLQEPLRMVRIYTQLLLKRLAQDIGEISLDETVKQYGNFVAQGVGRMTDLLADLLTFSRTVHEEQAPIRTADLSIALAEALSVLQHQIDETAAVITAESLPTVRGETPQLAHVFQNLLSNAIKYRRAAVAPRISIGAELRAGTWTVSVADNGIGFEQQYAYKIFGLFKRLHSNNEYPGTGLGLAICQRIVERYGGKIWAEGKIGEGATFYFSLAPAASK